MNKVVGHRRLTTIKLRALVEANICTTVRELAPELDVTYTAIYNHMREIGAYFCQKFLFKLRYVHLNLKVKNGKNFLDNLIVHQVLKI